MEDSDPVQDTLSRKVGRVEVGNEPDAKTCTPAAEWTMIQVKATHKTFENQCPKKQINLKTSDLTLAPLINFFP